MSHTANTFSGTVQSGDLTVWNRTAHVSFSLFAPHHFSQDAGLLPWNVFSKDIMQIDAADGRAWLLKQLPPDVASWTSFRIESVFGSYLIPLNIQVPRAGGGTWDVDIDTGDPRGISLSPADWKTWKAAHPQAPLTYSDVTEQSYFGGPEFAIAEQSWARQFSLGPLEFADTQIEADHMFLSSLANTFGKSHLMIGFQALRQYDVIVDGVHGFIYFHPKKTSPVVLPHNRLGAVFIPHGFGTKISSPEMKKIGTNTSLEARVATNTPAYEAGIRDGDVLLGIEGYNGPTSGGDAMAKLLACFSAPAGSKIVFNLKRGNKPFAATAFLQNILPPSPTAQTPVTPSMPPTVSLAITQAIVNLVTNALAGPPDFVSQSSHRLLYVELQSLNRAATAILNRTASDAGVQAYHVLLDEVITRAQQIANRPGESRDTVDRAKKLVEDLTALRKQLP